MGWAFQWLHKVDNWGFDHDDFEKHVKAWKKTFTANPLDPELEAQSAFDSQHGHVLLYPVPYTPLVVVVLIEKQTSYDPDRWVRILAVED